MSFSLTFLLISTQLLFAAAHPVASPQDDGDEAAGLTQAAVDTAQTLEGVGTLVNGILQGVAALPIINLQNPFKSATTQAPTQAPQAAAQALPSNVQIIPASALQQLLGTVVPAVNANAEVKATTAVAVQVEEGDDDDDLESDKLRV